MAKPLQFTHRYIVRVDSSTSQMIEEYSRITGEDISTTIRRFLTVGGTMSILDLYDPDDQSS